MKAALVKTGRYNGSFSNISLTESQEALFVWSLDVCAQSIGIDPFFRSNLCTTELILVCEAVRCKMLAQTYRTFLFFIFLFFFLGTFPSKMKCNHRVFSGLWRHTTLLIALWCWHCTSSSYSKKTKMADHCFSLKAVYGAEIRHKIHHSLELLVRRDCLWFFGL